MWLAIAMVLAQYEKTAPQYLDRVEEQFPMSAEALDALLENGLVVPASLHAPCFTVAYEQIVQKQVPVLVTADSVLHAFDDGWSGIVRDLEHDVFASQLPEMLFKMWRNLPSRDEDAGLYLAAAIRLMAGADAWWPDEPAGIQDWMGALERRTPQTIALFGERRAIDPADFEPRGHYRQSRALKNYFRAMTWLERVPLRMDRSRERGAARAITESIDASGQRRAFERLFATLTYVGGRAERGSPVAWRAGHPAEEFRLFGPSFAVDDAAMTPMRRVETSEVLDRMVKAPEAVWRVNARQEFLRAVLALRTAPVSAPRVFHSEAWAALKRQSQLAAWSELRHDGVPIAEAANAPLEARAPAIYVEPYPEVYARLGDMLRYLDDRLGPDLMAGRFHRYLQSSTEAMDLLHDAAEAELAGARPDGESAKKLAELVRHLNFEGHEKLERPGWYDGLFYAAFVDACGSGPQSSFRPTVVTLAAGDDRLAVGVGSVNFAIALIDGTAYVGPVYSYFEIRGHDSATMRDGEWKARLEASAPPRPAWTSAFLK